MGISVTEDELLRAKRAILVFSECFDAAYGGKKLPLELSQDMLTLVKLIRKVEEARESKEK